MRVSEFNARQVRRQAGISSANYGSYHLWGDVPALMPNTKAIKEQRGSGGLKVPSESGRRTDPGKGARFTSRDCGMEAGTKVGGDWSSDPKSLSRTSSSKSSARKQASAMIAKIPLILSRHIAATYRQ